MLRHLGREKLDIEGKEKGELLLKSSSGNLSERVLFDLSGGSLVQNLFQLPAPEEKVFQFVTPSCGIETPLRKKLEDEVFQRTMLTQWGVLWSSSGSDAMEIALWAADIFLKETVNDSICTYIVRRGGYHGNTFLTRFLSTRGRLEKETLFDNKELIILEETSSTKSYNPLQNLHANVNECGLLEQLKQAESHGKLKYPAVLILETLPTTGYNYWPGLSTYNDIICWCHARGIIVIFDEIAAGVYRHGWFSAFAQDDSTIEIEWPDIITFSKGLTSGTYPLGSALFSSSITNFLEIANQRPLSFTHGLTEPAAWYALKSFAIYDQLFERGIFEKRCTIIKEQSLETMNAFAKNGIGLFSTSTTIRLDLPGNLIQPIMESLRQAGYWAYCGSSCFPTKYGSTQRGFLFFCPPFDLELKYIEKLLRNSLHTILDKLVN